MPKRARRMKKVSSAGWKQIGVVGVDSGQVMICDPCYIASEWSDEDLPDNNHPVYIDKVTGQRWQFCYGGKSTLMGVKAIPGNYDTKIAECGNLSPNELRALGRWEVAPEEEQPMVKFRGQFSYPGCCETSTGESGQLNYQMGHAGVGVVSRTMIGDGSYPVFALKDGTGRTRALLIDFEVDDYNDGKLLSCEKVMKDLLAKTKEGT